MSTRRSFLLALPLLFDTGSFVAAATMGKASAKKKKPTLNEQVAARYATAVRRQIRALKRNQRVVNSIF